ncbi:MAG: hypothetical protein RBS57_13040 [Desulforhabdus sp.]|jgi:hypothetical protein|nr:hypothetical protein [Desulforhabdus sp.]
MRLLQCFFETQKYETDYSTNDLFIVFDAPFVHSIQYSRELKEALVGQYEASREQLREEAIASDWNFAAHALPDSATGFVRSLCSFGATHHGHIGHLAAVLMPQSVSDGRAFAAWLSRALTAGVPERLRFIVVDSIETPRLSDLGDSVRHFSQVQTLKVDAVTIAQETFAQEGGVGPAAVFRNYLMDVVTLIEKGSAEQVKAKAADAFAFARKQQWTDQEVVLAVLMAGAWLKEKQFHEAARTYQDARQGALQTIASGHPAGQQLVLQTWFGEAGVHLAAGDVERAARCYDEAASIAKGIPHPILAIEALRMGAFCRARMGNRQDAIEKLQSALLLGRRLKPEARVMTTLPIAAIDLLRVIEPERVERIEQVKRRFQDRIVQSRMAVEQRAAALEAGGDVEQLRAEEKRLAVATARGEKQAVAELDMVVAQSGEKFRRAFAEGRELLGAPWPIFCEVALPQSQLIQAAGK